MINSRIGNLKIMLVLLAAAIPTLAGSWEAVTRVMPDQKIEVTARDGTRTQGSFVSGSADAIIVRGKAGERSFTRAEVQTVRVYDGSRRLRQGLLWTAIGAGAGAGVGFAVCPYCSNEGHGDKYVGPGVAIGAGLGALGFLSSPYRTVYRGR